MVDDLKNLPPEERIKKLKELEKKRKEELKNAKELIKESEDELKEEQEKKQDIPIDQLKAVDVEALLTEEEKQLFNTKRYKGEELEKKILEEVPKLKKEHFEKAQEQYQIQLSKQPTQQLYEKLKNIYSSTKEQGEVSYEQAKEVVNINYALQRKREDIKQGNYTEISNSVAEQMIVSYKMGKKMKDMYRGKNG